MTSEGGWWMLWRISKIVGVVVVGIAFCAMIVFIYLLIN
jgi:hypothetical protein